MLGLTTVLLKQDKKTEQTKDLTILVSVLPQKQIVERIAGDTAQVTALIPPGYSPATYEPSTQDLRTISDAHLYFRIGHIPFEKQNISRFAELNPDLNIVDSSANNQLRKIEEHHHEDETTDPHVWLAPLMVQKQAEIIKDTLTSIKPEHASIYEENFAKLSTELEKIDQKLSETFAPMQGETILVYHPAFGYLADHYGFVQEHIEIEGKSPSINELQEIIAKAKSENVKVIFVQKQFSTDAAKAIADNIDGTVVEIDPLAADYLGNIISMAETIYAHNN